MDWNSLLVRIMEKKDQKKKKASKQKKGEKKPSKKIEIEEPDYGGLPLRDLKKNLGCG